MKPKPKPACAVAELVAAYDRAAEKEYGVTVEVSAETMDAGEPECLVCIETGDPRFDRARKMWSECQASFWKTMEGMVMLGGELLYLKKSLGFEGSGSGKKQNPHRVGFTVFLRTWEEWCSKELHISAETASRYIGCFQAVQGRGKRLTEDSAAIRLLGTPAAELSDKDRDVLRTIVKALINGDSQKALLLELRINKPSKPLTGGDTSAARKAKLAKMTPEMASSLWRAAWERMAKGAKAIRTFRNREDLKEWLDKIPPVSGDPEVIGLIEYRGKLATILEDARDNIEAILTKMDDFIEAKRNAEAAAHESAIATAKYEAAAAKRASRKKNPQPKQ